MNDRRHPVVYRTVDYHTAGEPFRIVDARGPEILAAVRRPE